MLFRTCSKCGVQKAMSHYHRDSKGKDNYSARCKVCKNSSRKPKDAPPSVFSQKKVSEPIEEKTKAPVVKIKIEKEKDLFERLTEKFNAFFTITCNPSGLYTIQIHSTPIKYSSRGSNIEQLIENLLSIEKH